MSGPRPNPRDTVAVQEFPCRWKGQPGSVRVLANGLLALVGPRGENSADLLGARVEQVSRRPQELRLTLQGTQTITVRDPAEAARIVAAIRQAQQERHDLRAARRDGPFEWGIEPEDRSIGAVRSCVHLGGSGLDLIVHERYNIGFSPTGVVFADGSPDAPVRRVGFDELRSITLDGPGRVTTNAGVVATGGPGFTGAVESMLVARVLNSWTSRTTVQSMITLTLRGGEAFFLHEVLTPTELRLHLSEVFVRLRDRDASPAAAVGLVDQLRELADLHAAGALTAEEFAAAKAKLLHDSE